MSGFSAIARSVMISATDTEAGMSTLEEVSVL